jgi:hypothetical protein
MLTRKSEVRFDAVGVCIYCGCSCVELLSDEHIVPFSLEGIWVLPKSSCDACAKITSRFELTCSRDIYGSFRMRENLRTRRPSKRPTKVKVTVESNGVTSEEKVEERGAIAQFPIFRLQPLGALRIPPVEIDTWEGVIFELKSDSPRDSSLWNHLPSGKLSFNSSIFNVEAFALLCAKIGHSYGVAVFGLDAFSAWLPQYILGAKNGLSHLIGSSNVTPLQNGSLTSLSWSVYETTLGILLAVHIQLFPSMGQPPVVVIIGNLSSDQYAKARAHPDRSS